MTQQTHTHMSTPSHTRGGRVLFVLLFVFFMFLMLFVLFVLLSVLMFLVLLMVLMALLRFFLGGAVSTRRSLSVWGATGTRGPGS